MSIAKLNFGPSADQSVVSEYTLSVLKDVLEKAGELSALITSTARTPYKQAAVMYNNIVVKGVDSQLSLYKTPGRNIIATYMTEKAKGSDKDTIIKAMEAKIVEQGPYTVSKHCADPKVLGVVDIAPSSVINKEAFSKALKEESRISLAILPGNDPAFHIEIPQK